MQWQRSEELSTPQPTPKSIPDSDSLRQAALQASWSRDRRVAQRRIAWRWTAWYAQKYAPHALAGMVVLVAGAYLAGLRLHWPLADNAEGRPDRELPLRYTPPSVPTQSATTETPPELPTPVPVDVDPPLVLRNSLTLEPRTGRPAPDVEASADTLSLKPENWLHSKEP